MPTCPKEWYHQYLRLNRCGFMGPELPELFWLPCCFLFLPLLMERFVIVRMKYFNTFIFFGYGSFCFIRITSPPYCAFPTFFIWWLPSGFLYLVDKALRRVAILGHNTRIYKVILHPSNVIEILFFVRRFSFRPGQFLYLNVPSLSRFQWHPFSITSCPLPSAEHNVCSIHVRMTGDWTERLGALCGASLRQSCSNSSLQGSDNLSTVPDFFPFVSLDGPYGLFCENIHRFKIVILIGAGIGQTPFASLLRFLRHEYQSMPELYIANVYFYAIARETNSFKNGFMNC